MSRFVVVIPPTGINKLLHPVVINGQSRLRVIGFGGLSPEFAEAVRTHEKYIGEQTLATEVRVLEGAVDGSEAEIGEMKFRISIQR